METKAIINKIIDEFNENDIVNLFREKTRRFKIVQNRLERIQDDDFPECYHLGEFALEDQENMIVMLIKVNKNLSERSGKKAQYELAKKLLKNSIQYSNTYYLGGLFIFYDEKNDFRFSLIYDIPLATGVRKWSNFRRYTYFVSKTQTNKTFISQIEQADFSSLEKIIEAFSVEKVTKQFYDEVQNWYFWAMDKVKYPDDYKYSIDPEEDLKIRNSTNLIRLITRIIFIWFLKEKGLIPQNLFSPKDLKNIVLDFNKNQNSSNYYNAILQNLFFATLNQKMKERKFAKNQGYPKNKEEYGVKNLFRYKEKFLIQDEEEILELFKDIPFLNGGLFDCLDKEDETEKVIYIDGFSREPKKQAILPDYLFFQEEEKRVDLSIYGLGKDKSVEGLIGILNKYNFTIDENTPVDQEIALDPELLGKVFENLLASYNPETATTARKATGSYYTPREIVDYMVEESLTEYLLSMLSKNNNDYEKDKENRNEDNSIRLKEKIKMLLSYSEEIPEFSDEEREKILKVISNIKILDPACGSGAFPMGILHKLVNAIKKLDPNNKYWFELQYTKAVKETEEVYKSPTNIISGGANAVKEIYETFDENINYPDYARKLYLIENCIYGVDIQPIAIQISKLRFFISLVLDQKVRKDKENFGIRPLPNLETKFVAANTLIGLEKSDDLLYTEEIEKIENEIKSLRQKYFAATTRKEKDRYKKIDEELKKGLVKELKDLGFPDESSNKIARFDLYDQNASADWFDPEFMFGVKIYTEQGRIYGFDIVIGNPPYIQLQKDRGRLALMYEKQNYQTFARTGDIYTLFYEKGLQLLKPNGILTFITSNKWMRAGYGEKTRAFFIKYNPLKLIDLGPGVFENATVDTNILMIQKASNEQKLLAVTLQKENSTVDIAKQLKERGVILNKLTKDAWFIGSSAEQQLKEKIERIGKLLKDWDVKIYRGVLTGLNEAFIIDSKKREEILNSCKDDAERSRTEAIIKPILRGRDIKRYYYEWAGLWVIFIPWHFPLHEDTSIQGASKKAEEQFQKQYPAIYNHLLQFKEQLSKRNKEETGIRYEWYAMQRCAATYYPEFEKEKVVWTAVNSEYSFTVLSDGIYFNNAIFMITGGKSKYFCALFNSKLIRYYLTFLFSTEENYTYASKENMQKIPLPPITATNQGIVLQIEGLVDKILSAKKESPNANTLAWEREIDSLVYKLYDLTEEEIKTIEK